MNLVGLWRVKLQQSLPQVLCVGLVVAGDQAGSAFRVDFRKDGVDAVQAGSRHESDVALGHAVLRWVQSKAAMLVPRINSNLSPHWAVC